MHGEMVLSAWHLSQGTAILQKGRVRVSQNSRTAALNSIQVIPVLNMMESQSIAQVISTYQHSVKTLFWISRKRLKSRCYPLNSSLCWPSLPPKKSVYKSITIIAAFIFSPTAAIRLGVKIGGGIPLRKAKESRLPTKLARDFKKFLSVWRFER